jgi:hypothetical protein
MLGSLWTKPYLKETSLSIYKVMYGLAESVNSNLDEPLNIFHYWHIAPATGEVYQEIYGGICHIVFDVTPRSMDDAFENLIKSKINEYLI